MKKLNKIRKAAALITLLCSLGGSLMGCSVGEYKIVFDTNAVPNAGGVFSVNTQRCSISEGRLYLANYLKLYGSAYDIDLKDFDFGELSVEEYAREVTLEELSRLYCMEQIAAQQDITLDEKELQLAEKAAGEYLGSLTAEEKQWMGVDEQMMAEYYGRYAIANKLYTSLADSARTEISEDDARILKAQVMLVKDSSKAAEVADKLKSGTDFMKLAADYNTLEKTEYTVSREMFGKEVNRVLFALDDNQVSEPVNTSDGTYFFRVTSKYVQDLTAANKSRMQKEIEVEAFNKLYRAFVEESIFSLNTTEWKKVRTEEGLKLKTGDFFLIYDKYFN